MNNITKFETFKTNEAEEEKKDNPIVEKILNFRSEFEDYYHEKITEESQLEDLKKVKDEMNDAWNNLVEKLREVLK